MRELAQTYDVSRTFLYDLRDRALDVLIEGLSPRTPGPQPQQEPLMIDRAFIQRAITVMPMLKGTVRDIQQGPRLLFGIQRLVGYISQTLTLVSRRRPTTSVSLCRSRSWVRLTRSSKDGSRASRR